MHPLALSSGGPWGHRQPRYFRATATLRALIPGLLVIALGFAPPAAAGTDERIATVGEEIITTGEFSVFLSRYLREKLYHGGSKEMIRRIAFDALDTLVSERLLARAVERRGIEGNPQGVADQIAGYREKYSGSPQWPEIEPRLAAIERSLLLNSKIGALREIVEKVEPPSETTLRAFHKDNPKLFTQPEAYDIGLILIGVPPSALQAEWVAAAARADELWNAITNGSDFAELARAHSTDPSAAKGGAVGRIHEGQLPDAAHSAATSMVPGELSEPIRVLEGYVLLRLNDRFDAVRQPFATVRDRVEALYRRDRAQTQWNEYLAQLRAETEVKTYKVKQHVEAILSGN